MMRLDTPEGPVTLLDMSGTNAATRREWWGRGPANGERFRVTLTDLDESGAHRMGLPTDEPIIRAAIRCAIVREQRRAGLSGATVEISYGDLASAVSVSAQR